MLSNKFGEDEAALLILWAGANDRRLSQRSIAARNAGPTHRLVVAMRLAHCAELFLQSCFARSAQVVLVLKQAKANCVNISG